jgi:hypothetical protein
VQDIRSTSQLTQWFVTVTVSEESSLELYSGVPSGGTVILGNEVGRPGGGLASCVSTYLSNVSRNADTYPPTGCTPGRKPDKTMPPNSGGQNQHNGEGPVSGVLSCHECCRRRSSSVS